MQVSFPYPVRVISSTPKPEGFRMEPFTNIDGEPFARPTLNGRWRVEMQLMARGMQAQLALSSFNTAMSGNATCVIPICTQWRPNDRNGRMLARGGVAPEYTFDHVGFANDPFDGFTLRSPAARRHSFIDINKPALSHLWAGHLISLGDRLHHVVNVSAIDESETAVRVSVMPSIRDNHDAGTIVLVDQLRLKVQMESGEPLGFGIAPMKFAAMSFIEAF